MTSAKRLLTVALFLAFLAAPALAENCEEPKTGTKDVPIFSPPLGNVVTGSAGMILFGAECGLRD